MVSQTVSVKSKLKNDKGKASETKVDVNKGTACCRHSGWMLSLLLALRGGLNRGSGGCHATSR